MRNLSYCGDIVRNQAPDLFLLALFVPEAARESLLAVYALDAELAHVHHIVHEEMIGHIRYAWWQEALEAIAQGEKPREHPVLVALPSSITPECLKLVEHYRSAYPELPSDRAIMEEISLAFIRADAPQAEAGWRKAKAIIDRHRARFGPRLNFWMHVKLLLV
jgi:phytoene/squalene synthetase